MAFNPEILKPCPLVFWCPTVDKTERFFREVEENRKHRVEFGPDEDLPDSVACPAPGCDQTIRVHNEKE